VSRSTARPVRVIESGSAVRPVRTVEGGAARPVRAVESGIRRRLLVACPPVVRALVALVACALVACAFVACAFVACSDDAGPRLDAVTPPAAARDATVEITGRRLCGAGAACATAAGEVQIGSDPPTVRAVVVSYSDTSAQIVIPSVAPVGDTVLIVTVNERSSNALEFEVLP
jgi:hypothetical protein